MPTLISIVLTQHLSFPYCHIPQLYHQQTTYTKVRLLESIEVSHLESCEKKVAEGRAMMKANHFVAPLYVKTFAVTSQYISCTILIYFLGILFFVIAYQNTSLGALSYAFSKSIKPCVIFCYSSIVQNCFHCRSFWHKFKLILLYGYTSPYIYLYYSFS